MLSGSLAIAPLCFVRFTVAVVAAVIVVKPIVAMARNSDKPICYNFLYKENVFI